LSNSAASKDELGRRVYDFALRVIRLADGLPPRRIASKVLGTQLLRSATSIAANYEEARGAISHPDFVAKMGVAYKESRESVLWLSLIRDVGLVKPARMTEIVAEAMELRAIFGTSLKTACGRQRRK
jgi:four helix bundle protein